MTINEVFQALSDPTRRQILSLLRERHMTAGEISEHFSLARSTLSGHFNVLKRAGLIVPERNGTTITYSLNLSVVEQAMTAFFDIFDETKHSKTKKRK